MLRTTLELEEIGGWGNEDACSRCWDTIRTNGFITARNRSFSRAIVPSMRMAAAMDVAVALEHCQLRGVNVEQAPSSSKTTDTYRTRWIGYNRLVWPWSEPNRSGSRTSLAKTFKEKTFKRSLPETNLYISRFCVLHEVVGVAIVVYLDDLPGLIDYGGERW